MNRVKNWIIWILVVLLVGAIIIPLLVPIPPVENVQPLENLVYADSQFMEFNGLSIHYQKAGQGQPALVLLHGFLSSTFTWREVIGPLGEKYTALAFDRPAFGLTERALTWEGASPYTPEAQTDLVMAMLDHLGVEQAVLVGNSAGGALAMFTALRYPDRVQGLILASPAVYTGGGAPDWIKPLFGLPQVRRLGPLFVRQLASGGNSSLADIAWHDPGKLTPEILSGYAKSFQMADWDRALWEFTLASRDLKLDERLDELQLPVLVIAGDDDRIVPTDESRRLAAELPQAELVIIPACGHVPQEEKPQEFLAAVESFLEQFSR